MRLLPRLVRLVWGPEVDPALRPILAIGLVRSAAGATVWTFVGIWAIKHLGAGQTAVGATYLVSALVGVGAGYLGGHLSDHVGRRPLILVSWALQIGLLLGFVAAGDRELVGLGLMCLGGLFFQLGSAADQALVADLVPPERHEFGVIARDRVFLLFFLSGALAWLVYVAFEVVLPISLVDSHGIGPSTWGLLVVVNPVMVTPFHLRLTRPLR